ncbi:MAG: protein phosphatase 2C domain-containing protein [Halieaceae bacterium]
MSTVEMHAAMETCAGTHVARRKHNEDAFLVDRDSGLVIVADGVGGHQAGEVASGITCEVIASSLTSGADLSEAIRNSNKAVMTAVTDGRGREGMASTVVAALFDGADYRIDWVGDSRAYLWDGQLHLLTRDHSYVAAQLELGKITLEQARNHPRKNVIVQAIGLQSEENLRVDTCSGRLAAGETLLLCSDGLNDVLDSAQIAKILASGKTPQQRCDSLIEETVQAGGRDNVTVALVRAGDEIDSVGLQPAKVWTYDPATDEHLGLPEVVGVEITQPNVRRVTPKSRHSTQMMPVAQVEAMRQLAVKADRRERRNRTLWIVLLATVVTAVALGAAYVTLA